MKAKGKNKIYTINITKALAFVMFFFASSICIAGIAFASNFYSIGRISIIEPITMEELEKLNFGVMATPNSSEVLEITPNGLVGSSSTAQIIESSSISSAKIKIYGSNNKNINITAEYLENEATIDFLSIKGNYEGQEKELTSGFNNITSSSQGKDLSFGAKIQVSANIIEGNYKPEINLNINYE